ncbi:helix-turn-helix domain-containing protein [Nonomuraea ceibae]|uniref:helix-turn-helix domain-containing protein n=1 Tax=Nonomuraea ceibae TaxID=1935170 RepID=UPI001C6068A1|nr:helix-turn-helix transcriptional regulator [Nonomuraea ceibae]
MSVTAPPSPADVTDEAAFVAGLRALKTWSGLSFRQLERRAAAAGDTLPASTASGMLGRVRLPREEVLVAFVRACGLGEEDVRAWARVRAQLTTAPAPTSAPAPGESAVPWVDGEPEVGGTGRAKRAGRRARGWGRTVAAVAALVAAFAGGAALVAGAGQVSDEVQETTTAVVAR